MKTCLCHAERMERGVWIAAMWMVSKHGREAPMAVHTRIMTLRRRLSQERTVNFWLLVDEAVRQLVRMTPRPTDTIH
jgi:hypothetical protein